MSAFSKTSSPSSASSGSWGVMNTAVLTGRQVSQAMKVFIVSQAGKVADVTLQSSCHSEDESVLKEHIKSVTDNEVCSLLNLGPCGLHVVHGSLRTGLESVDWDISSLLRYMYYMFTDSPARRELFTQLTRCASFPLKFCGVLWLENAKCFQSALQIWDHVVKFFKESKLPKTKPVETLKRAACDPFLKCKLAFCKTIADECQPFLQWFQASKPITPYLFEAVEKLIRYLMNRCVKPDLMKCTGPKLLSIDTKKSENLILSKNIDEGFATKRLLGETASTVTERPKLEFIHECRSMLTTMIAKLQERKSLKTEICEGFVFIGSLCYSTFTSTEPEEMFFSFGGTKPYQHHK
uniref:Transmembrane protein family 132 fourth domain-containing protein n=1 Tax=Timema douglasi TaxID=61478 RepID=A0A7R8Z6Z2_TIMDO|nr:unnamed protein product [Timema douglasi]